MKYNIIATGSNGNCTVLGKPWNGKDETFTSVICVDMGVPYKKLLPHIKDIKLVLLTHIHSDHFNKSTIKKLAFERPTVRFVCGSFLADELKKLGVKNIDVLENGKTYLYSICKLSPVELHHDVPNYGWKIEFDGQKIFYATDTGHLDGITAKNYDLYFVEANYSEEEYQQRIYEKEENGEFIYERRLPLTHLSKEKADNFIVENAGRNSRFVYMHQHRGGMHG